MYVPYGYGGVWDDFQNGRAGWWGLFWNGWLRVYRDPTSDSAIGDAGSFQNGELILEFRVDDLDLWAEWCARAGTEMANLTLTGGALHLHVSPGGQPVAADATGEYVSTQLCDWQQACAVSWPEQIACLRSDVFLGPVQARPATWGRIKAQYR